MEMEHERHRRPGAKTRSERSRISGGIPRQLLYLPRNSWGEIEWALPILHRLRDLNPDLRVHTVFPSDRFFEEREGFPALFRLLDRVSFKIYRPLETIQIDTDWCWFDYSRPQRIVERTPTINAEIAGACAHADAFIKRLGALFESGRIERREYEGEVARLRPELQKLHEAVENDRERRSTEIEDAYFRALSQGELGEAEFDLILRDNGFDFRFHRLLLEHFARVPVVRGEHGFDLTNRTRDDIFEEFKRAALDKKILVGRGDLWFACCQNLADVLRVYWGEERTAVVGFPRLDRSWVQRVLEESKSDVASAGIPPA
ncbi:MAG: hypothetical protein ACE5IL_08135, partial [Myxococcota bacterium]